mgnify:CR=1 FL=1|jgi:hypothetical protein
MQVRQTETYQTYKRDLRNLQKRPTYMEKEAQKPAYLRYAGPAPPLLLGEPYGVATGVAIEEFVEEFVG